MKTVAEARLRVRYAETD